jgi:hypothetical protein
MQLICACVRNMEHHQKNVPLIHHAYKKYAAKTIKQNWKLWTSNKNHMIVLMNELEIN